MSDIVIKVEELSKQYRLGTINHGTLHQDLQSWWARLRGREDPNSIISLHHPAGNGGDNERFWALKDISFQVKQGELLGIIGRNGAGKSTLLKILSSVTAPSSGVVKIKGRVASLLEVGTGFHPELTGRENIFLNGAIFGMRKEEIKRNLDEIIAFADIEKFINTPVKRYSSGMYVRLAFAVAAHLEPEILIVDEVLAVGDIQFQKKCLGKMENVSKTGKTVLFVSHNMEAISTLCKKGIILADAKIAYQGSMEEAVSMYKKSMLNASLSVENSVNRGGAGGAKITDVWLSNESKEKTDNIAPDKPLRLNLKAEIEPAYQSSKNLTVGFGIDSFEGRRLFTGVSSWKNKEITTKGKRLEVSCQLPFIPLIPGKYLLSASISYQMDTLDYVGHCGLFEVTDDESSFHSPRSRDHGDITLKYIFEYRAYDN